MRQQPPLKIRVNLVQTKQGARSSLIKAYEILVPNHFLKDRRREQKADSHLYKGFLYTAERR